jgi:hypothetical protein
MDRAIAGLFVVLISLPLAWTALGPVPSADSEKRPLAPPPSLPHDWQTLRKFPARFEAYFNDHFGLRGPLIRLLATAKVDGLNVSSSPRVILGKQSWLFYNPQPALADGGVAHSFPPGELERWQRLVQARHDWLAQRGIRYLFVVAPDKQSVYPEFLPRGYRRATTRDSRLDRLLVRLRESSTVTVVDLRALLARNKGQGRLYDRTDTHWNDRGAWLATGGMVAALSRWFPALPLQDPKAFELVATTMWGGDLVALLGLGEGEEESITYRLRTESRARPVGSEGNGPAIELIAWETPDSQLPRAVVFRDSFADRLIPYLSESFRRVLYAGQAAPAFDREIILRERPDVVIQEVVERKLTVFVPAKGAEATDPLYERPRSWKTSDPHAE